MAYDPDLQLRGPLVRALLTLRDMLPGAFIERRRACGRSNGCCASGRPEDLHPASGPCRWSGRASRA